MRTFSSLRGRTVATESGRELGRCHDLRASSGSVDALVVGHGGWFEHFGIGPLRRSNAVAWDSVVRIDGDRIVVRDDVQFS
jgi:sporulation protein YlmC with PRC-barrel domain